MNQQLEHLKSTRAKIKAQIVHHQGMASWYGRELVNVKTNLEHHNSRLDAALASLDEINAQMIEVIE